ncbi:YozQ family protein [Bacillus songklensis]|uniref:YozQ family protein n=1 Tax=Bacillus songklensis TaxID=1069116 RepID=A0ABV8BAK7_9BACI
MDQKLPKETMQLSDKHYDVKDYDAKDQISSGLAITHEQVSDYYMGATIDEEIERSEGTQIDVPRKGNDE